MTADASVGVWAVGPGQVLLGVAAAQPVARRTAGSHSASTPTVTVMVLMLSTGARANTATRQRGRGAAGLTGRPFGRVGEQGARVLRMR